MYTAHYNLQRKPFQISSDAGFIWLGEKHKEGLATLRYGILDNKGFLVLTGDVGTGKTTLINALIAGLSSDVICASVPDPSLEKLDFFNYIAAAFGINGEFSSKGKFLFYFSTFLHRAHSNNQKVLLIIDESQLLTQELLEEIRLLSNIVTKDSSPLLNVFFVGQYEFNELIRRPENRAIAQRLTLNYYIEPLTLEETEEYIRHRLKVAGTTEKLFGAAAIKEIYAFSQGFPRRINIICDHCLMSGYAEDKTVIAGDIARESAQELHIPEHRKEQPPPISPDPPPEIPPTIVAPSPTASTAPVASAAPVDSAAPVTPAAPVDSVAPTLQSGKVEPPSHLSRLGSVLLIILVLLSCYLLFPDFIQDTFRRAGDYFISMQGKTGPKARQSAGPQVMQEPQGKAVLPASEEQSQATVVAQKPASAAMAGTAGEKGRTVSVEAAPEDNLPEPEGQLQPDLKAPAPVVAEQVKAPAGVKKNQQIKQPRELQAEPTVSDAPSGSIAIDSLDSIPRTIPPLPKESLVLRFKYDSNLFSEADVGRMKELARTLKMHPEAMVNVFGYTDSSGDEEYNKRLSGFRANMVKSFLMGQDLPSGQIRAEGLGSKNPIASNSTSDGRDQNRRVEISIDSKQ